MYWRVCLRCTCTCNSMYSTCNSCLMVYTVYGICTTRGLYVHFRGPSPRKYIQHECAGTVKTLTCTDRPYKANHWISFGARMPIIGRAGASPPSRTAGAVHHIYMYYMYLCHKHSAIKPAITDSGAHPRVPCCNLMYCARSRCCVGCDLRQDKMDQIEMRR